VDAATACYITVQQAISKCEEISIRTRPPGLARLAGATLCGVVAGVGLAGCASAHGKPAGIVRNETVLSTKYVSTGGSDAKTCTRVEPCASLARAYQVAKPGQTVELAGGTYPAQLIPYGLAKAGGLGHCDWSSNDSLKDPISDYSGCITFTAAPGAAVTLASVTLEVPYVRLRGLTLHYLVLGGHPRSNGTSCAEIKAHDEVADRVSITDGTFYIAADHSALINSIVDFGDTNNVDDKSGLIRHCENTADDGGAITHRSYMAVTHNTIKNLIQVGDVGGEPAHLQAIHIDGGDHVLVSRNRFRNNAAHNIFAQAQLYDRSTDWRIENNFFDAICSRQVTTANGGTCTDQGGDAITCGGNNLTNAVFSFNTFARDYPRWTPPYACTVSGTVLEIGNVGGAQDAYHCAVYQSAGATINYNLWDIRTPSGATCGRHDTRGILGLADPRTTDLHLTRTSAAIALVPSTVPDGCPRTDIDGDPRPLRAHCDAGADQRDPALIVPGRAIGKVVLGSSERDIVAFYGRARHVTAERWSGVHTGRQLRTLRYDAHGRALSIGLDHGAVVAVSTTSPYYTTRAGLGSGAPAPATTLRLLRWSACRKAYRMAAAGAMTYVTTRGRHNTQVRRISIIERAYDGCG
jgi:hypothetical protein